MVKNILSFILSVGLVVMSSITPMSTSAANVSENAEVEINNESEVDSMSLQDWHEYRVWLLQNPEYDLENTLSLAKANTQLMSSNDLYSGKCGENVNFSFDESSGTLDILGTGKMNDFTINAYPWSGYKKKIKTIRIGNDVTYIARRAFYDCSSLESVELNNVEVIGEKAFENCISLKSIEIPKSVNALYQPFYNCTSLTEVNVSDDNNFYKDIDGVLFDKECNILLYYPSNKQGNSYNIPSTVKSIEDNAFAYSKNYTDPQIPITCKLGNNVFYRSELIANWYNKGYAHRYVFNNNNGIFYLVINGELLSVKNDKNEPFYTLNFTEEIHNSYESITIDKVNLMDDYKSIGKVNKIISNPNIEINYQSLIVTDWFNDTNECVIYDDEDINNATYKFLYSYKKTNATVDATEYTHIGEKAFSKWKPTENNNSIAGTIYLSPETVLNEGFLIDANVKNIYVGLTKEDSTLIDIDYLKIPSKLITRNVATADEEDSSFDSFKYSLALATAKNKVYFDSLADSYCEKIIEELNINEFKTDAQKIMNVCSWMRQHSHYSEWDKKDEYGNNKYDGQRYSKSKELTHTKAALLLTGYGVCSAYAELFQCFMDKLIIPSIYISNNGCNADDIDKVGSHAWNLVKPNKNSNLWYYIDVTNNMYLIGQKNLNYENYVGFRQEDIENGTSNIKKLFTDNSYDYNTNKVSDKNYEPIKYDYLCLNNTLDDNYKVSLTYSTNLYSEVIESEIPDITYLFGEESFFNEGISICLNDTPIYTINSLNSIGTSNIIFGEYETKDNYKISYELSRKNDMINIDLFNVTDEYIYIDFNDISSLCSKYVIESNNTVKEYTTSAYVKLNEEFNIKFYDIDGSIITSADSMLFNEKKGLFDGKNAAYKLSSEVVAQRRIIKFMAHKLGDINMDGELTSKDASILQKYLIKGYQFIQTGSDGDLTIDIDNVTINGDISSNGTFTLNANNANINGTLSAQNFVNNITGNFNSNHPISNETFDMDYISYILSDSNMISYYFTNATEMNQSEIDNMLMSESNQSMVGFDTPLLCNGNIAMDYSEGNVKVNTNIKTTSSMTFRTNTFNMDDTVLYSENGNITISSTNFNFNGLIYAPNGKVTIDALNQNITGTIIAKEIEITGDSNVNFTVAAQGVLKNITDNLTLTNYQLLLADITKDYRINVIDLISLERAILNSAA